VSKGCIMCYVCMPPGSQLWWDSPLLEVCSLCAVGCVEAGCMCRMVTLASTRLLAEILAAGACSSPEWRTTAVVGLLRCGRCNQEENHSRVVPAALCTGRCMASSHECMGWVKGSWCALHAARAQGLLVGGGPCRVRRYSCGAGGVV
jgi:hypothetical protein